jgi:glycosyltransferase involved in cell wall biosynthesis
MFPKVSIQIPTYNQQQSISRAIESCLSQDYPHLEIVVADDASADDTSKVVHSFNDPRIRYFRNPVNIGRVANHRKALYEYSTGEWVVNLDGDDYYTDPGFISRAMRLINTYRGQGHNVVFYQALIKIHNNITGKETARVHQALGDREFAVFDNYYLDVYRRNKFFSHLTTVYHRETAMRIGFYEHDTLNIDFESIARLSFYGKAILDNHVAGVWSVHEQNATQKARGEFKEKGKEILGRIKEYAKEAYGNAYEPLWKKKVEKENDILYLELLAENGYFFSLLKHIVQFRRPYSRIPKLAVKSAIKNLKFLMKG